MNATRTKCPGCGAIVQIETAQRPGQQTLYCQYCGSAVNLQDDVLRTEHTTRIIDEARVIEAQTDQKRLALEEERLRKSEEYDFRKGKFSKALIVFFIISILFAAVEISDNRGLTVHSTIGLIQTVLFATSWVLGMGLVRTKHNIYAVLGVSGFLLYIPWLATM